MIRYAGLGGTSNYGFYFAIEGLDEMQSRVDLIADYLTREASVQMMNEVGENVAEWMRQNVLANFTQRTGALYASIDFAVLSNDAGDVSLAVGPNDQSLLYTAIHEFGGDIYPVKKKYLSWVGDDGKRRFAKHVQIPDRPYIRPAFTDHENEIITIMEEYLYDAIAGSSASI